MHIPFKGITDIGQAGLVVVALAATWAVPATLAAVLSPPTSTVAKNQRDGFDGDKGRIEYQPPPGWIYIGQGSSDHAVYQSGGRVLQISHVAKATDIPKAINRQIRSRSLRGALITLDDRKVKTSTNFTGRYCRAGSPMGDHQGTCAMFGQKDSLVIVMSLAPDGTRPHEIEPIVDSFTFKENAK
ncbi:hypothetical protein SAMN05421595_0053 [Austwickia chelonae]|uniref:Uncharacterized protein n=1 Tax=Austwickia chelonae NBRC 105200 TaxID=1184607 RepID=K6WAH5_9MICO|nr:hypothetical protein [Austwickia chelonae]GAB78842.1 hypothetical protein AUCHE_17_00540 [Austwickia chelonae NBRC 105200]SEV85160.1 hypothetical protein SAMN05421595_0053 [Austwickia chelonae]